MRFSKIDSIRPDQLDFVPRERRSRIVRLLLAFTLIIALTLAFAYAPPLQAYASYAPLIAAGLMALLGLYVIYHEQIILDLVLSTEYQNLLFTQALGIGTSFFMIARRDGTVVYASEGLGDLLPGYDYAQAQALEGLFTLGTVRKTDRERILGAIHSNAREHLVFPVISQYQQTRDFILTVEPMPRPAGFSVLRGREYLGQRTGMQRLPDSLNATSVDKLDHLLATTDIAHYTTDAYGRFEYVNPAFERLFGYENGEIVDSHLGLPHLVVSFGATTLTEEYSLGDYSGPATILTRQAGQSAVAMHQLVIRNAEGKPLGATGTLTATGMR